MLKDFYVQRANDNLSVIKFSVEKDKEAAFRQITAQWLKLYIPGARLIRPKWYIVKVDQVKVALVIDIDSKKVRKLAIKRFRVENRVEVYIIRQLRRPRPSGQYVLVVIKVATKEDAEKLLRINSVLFGGGAIVVSLFKEQRTLVACFKYRRFRHRARDCIQPDICDMCGQKGYLQYKIVNLRCVNC